MKYMYLYLLTSLILVSCKQKKILALQRVNTDEKVQLYFDIRNPNKDSINLSILLEYKLNKNNDKIYSLKLSLVSNGKQLENIKDFRIYNKVSHELLYATAELNPKQVPDYLLITENDIRISKQYAQELLIKYQIHKNISEIEDSDTINLISYNQFKIDNQSFMKELNKVNDSINFKVIDRKDQEILIRKKIYW